MNYTTPDCPQKPAVTAIIWGSGRSCSAQVYAAGIVRIHTCHQATGGPPGSLVRRQHANSAGLEWMQK